MVNNALTKLTAAERQLPNRKPAKNVAPRPDALYCCGAAFISPGMNKAGCFAAFENQPEP